MIFTKLLYFLLAFNSKGNNDITYYYKIIYHKNNKGCVEANITKRIANTFNANPGKCIEQNCTDFKGVYILPFCCKVYGYECYDNIITNS